VDACITVLSGDVARESSELAEWLRRDRGLLSPVAPVPRRAGPTHLGGVVEVEVAAVGSGGAAAALVRTLGAWLGTRTRQVSVEVRTDKGRIKLDVRNLDAEETRALLQQILTGSDD
jgi:Effector Associated Constant Component 1